MTGQVMIAASWLPKNHNRFPKYHIWLEETEIYKTRSLCWMSLPDGGEILDCNPPERVVRESLCVRCVRKIETR